MDDKVTEEPRPRGVVENVGSVASTLIKTQPPGFVMTLLFCFGIMGLFAWNNHDIGEARINGLVKIFESNNEVQLERLQALVKLFEACTGALQQRITPPVGSKGSFNWDAADVPLGHG
jgi:hypothetical protein